MLSSLRIRLLLVFNLLAAAVLIYQWRDAQVNALVLGNTDRIGSVENPILLASEADNQSGGRKQSRGKPSQTPREEPSEKPREELGTRGASKVEGGAVVSEQYYGLSSEPACVRVGPYFSVSTARKVATSVGLVDYRIESEDFTDEKVDYRVYLPPAKSIEEAYRTRKLLRSSNIDSFVMTDGPLARGVSLGVFSSRASAESFKSQSSIVVYKPVVAPISRVQRSHWLQLDYAPVERDKLIAEIIRQSPTKGVSAQVLCQ